MLLRLVGVKLSHLVSGYEQIGLYGPSEKVYNLYQSMDKMRSKYGYRHDKAGNGTGPMKKKLASR
jgi:hypothetical protein